MSQIDASNRTIRGVDEVYLNLTSNLSLLCTYYDSIAQVCRLIGINRQRFNKYLNGTAFPS